MDAFDEIEWLRLDEAALGAALDGLSFGAPMGKMPDGNVLIGKCYFTDRNLLNANTDILSSDEKTRAEKFRFDKHSRRYVLGRTLLRMALGNMLNVDASIIEIDASVDGKPRLEGDYGRALFFNVTHTDAALLFAFSGRDEIGVDVETYSRIKADELGRIFEFVAHPEEKAFWADCAPARRPYFFTRLWTMKEAVLKAHGTGLRIEARKINLGETLFGGYGSVAVGDAQYRVTSGALDDGHHFAVAVYDS